MSTILQIVLIGEESVGKTSIIEQFTKGSINQDLHTTTSAQFSTGLIILEELNQTIKSNIWDVPGHTQYKQFAKIFYKNANVICLCYDRTKKSSFQKLKDFWYEKEIKINVAHDPILVIVANKNDVYDIKEVEDEEGKAFAEEINTIFQSTSAMSYNSIRSLFDNIARKYFDPSFDTNDF